MRERVRQRGEACLQPGSASGLGHSAAVCSRVGGFGVAILQCSAHARVSCRRVGGYYGYLVTVPRAKNRRDVQPVESSGFGQRRSLRIRCSPGRLETTTAPKGRSPRASPAATLTGSFNAGRDWRAPRVRTLSACTCDGACTAPDFIAYLVERENLVGRSKAHVIAHGEEDLLTAHVGNIDAAGERHQFRPGEADGEQPSMVMRHARPPSRLAANY